MENKELADACQEVEQLTDLLRATQEQLEQAELSAVTGSALAPNQELAALIETLTCIVWQTAVPPDPCPFKSTKKTDIPILVDRKDSTFISWKKLIVAKLTNNADHFETEASQIYYIFSYTSREVQKYL